MATRKWSVSGLAALLFLLGQKAAGQTVTPAQRPACTSAEYRQLDFWVGDWNVVNTSDGVRYATSRIEKIMNGCAIKESYEAPKAPGGPYSGTSYTSFDRKAGQWQQMYVDVNGNSTWYSGKLEGTEMALYASAKGAVQRMTYHPLADGSVQQIGTISMDGGKTWKTGYDYTYRRSK